MVHHVFTRQALYNRVWSEPIRTVASTLGVSDVGLAKACRAAGTPTPPRGYWTRRPHGQLRSTRPPLSPFERDRDQVVIAPARRRSPSPTVQAALDAASLTRSADADRGAVHGLVQTWMADQEERREAWRRNGWALAGLEDPSRALVRRRLRLTSDLLWSLEARALEVSQSPEGWAVEGHGERLAFSLYERSRIDRRPATTEERRWRPDRTTVRATVPAGDLVLKIRGRLSVQTEFRELKTPLEAQLVAIAANLEAGLLELAERRRLQVLEDERTAASDRARRKQQAYAEARAGLLDRLNRQAERHRQAEAIRAYLAAADRAPLAARPDFAAWKAWALEQAEAMDPLKDGSAPFSRLPPIEEWEWRGE